MHVTGHEFRKLKKEKVKAYIQQIKSMVPPSKERGKKTGTLKALQHVIDKLKNLKGQSFCHLLFFLMSTAALFFNRKKTLLLIFN